MFAHVYPDAKEKRCLRCCRVLIRRFTRPFCPDCDREGLEEERKLRDAMANPGAWDNIVWQDKRTLAFCRDQFRVWLRAHQVSTREAEKAQR